MVGMGKSLGGGPTRVALDLPEISPEITPLPHLRTGPDSAPLPRSQALSHGRCWGDGTGWRVSLWDTLGDSPQGDGWHPLPFPAKPMSCMSLTGVRLVIPAPRHEASRVACVFLVYMLSLLPRHSD